MIKILLASMLTAVTFAVNAQTILKNGDFNTPISDEALKSLVVAIQLADKDAEVLIDNVTLVKK